jgi:hypothetical protein
MTAEANQESVSKRQKNPTEAGTPKSVPAAVPNADEIQKKRADYNRLVRTARLANLLLEKVDFKILPDALGIKQSLLTRSLTPTIKVMSYGISDGTCVANVIWEVTFKYKSKNVVRCAASYIISYDGITDCSEETVGVFLEHVGKVATYAYFRALYAHLDWSANLGSQPLPVLQLQPKL